MKNAGPQTACSACRCRFQTCHSGDSAHEARNQAAIGLLALLAAVPLHAEEWQHELAPYLWGAAMSGNATVGAATDDVDMSFGDILDNLEMGFMGAYRATRGQYSVTVDGIYMDLGAAGRGPAGYVKADIDLDQSALEVDVGYEVVERLVVLAGLRYNDLSAEVKVTGPLGNTSSDGSRKAILSKSSPVTNRWSVPDGTDSSSPGRTGRPLTAPTDCGP